MRAFLLFSVYINFSKINSYLIRSQTRILREFFFLQNVLFLSVHLKYLVFAEKFSRGASILDEDKIGVE